MENRTLCRALLAGASTVNVNCFRLKEFSGSKLQYLSFSVMAKVELSYFSSMLSPLFRKACFN